MKKIFYFILDVFKIAAAAFLVVLPIRYFIFQPFLVKGESMEPSFSNGDYLIVDEISYRFREVERGEVLIFKYPKNPSQRFIKRVVGLPGETVLIQDGAVLIQSQDGKFVLDESNYLPQGNQTAGSERIFLEEGEYFVMGDNRDFSLDSRIFGVLPEGNIIGRVLLRAWPVAAFAKIEAPAY